MDKEQIQPIRLGLALLLLAFTACASVPTAIVPVASTETADEALALSPDAALAEAFEKIRQDSNAARAFFLAMPKAGELHHHLTGAVYAETLIQLATYQADCIDPETYAISKCPSGKGEAASETTPAAQPDVTLDTPDCRACDQQGVCKVQGSTLPMCCLCGDQKQYDGVVNALSMRGTVPGTLEAHDHFFSIFGKFGDSLRNEGAVTAQLRHQAAGENISYLETMLSGWGGGDALNQLLADYKQEHDADLCVLLTGEDGDQVVPYAQWPKNYRDAMQSAANTFVDEILGVSDQLLGCEGANPDPGCDVVVRLLPELHRTRALGDVCIEALRAFTFGHLRPEIVGMNIVAPEDAYRSRVDYTAHMHLIGNLGRIFPSVGRALHAGELWEGLVPPDDMRFHIREAIEIAGTDRVGHGVAITYEDDSAQLLDRMAGKEAAPMTTVEINLVSNAQLLGVSGSEHPLPLYVREDVPVVFSTDDPGIMRTSLTEQFLLAAEGYPELTYLDFRRFNRNVLAFSFLIGDGIWEDPNSYQELIAPCRQDDGTLDRKACRDWASRTGSERAMLQIRLEEDLREFEAEVLE